MCKVQRDAWLLLASHYLSSSAATSISAMLCIREIWANGWYERHCTCLSTSPLQPLTSSSHQDFDCVERVLTADWEQRQNVCSTAYFNPLTWWRMLTEGRTRSHSWMSRCTEPLNANTKAFTRTQGSLHKPHSMYKYSGMCKSTPTHLQTWWNTQSDAPVRLSRVWLETLLACDLFVVSHCYCVYRFIPFYRRKTSSSLCYSTTNPSFSFLSPFFSFTFYCVFSHWGKRRLYILFPSIFIQFNFMPPFSKSALLDSSKTSSSGSAGCVVSV